MPKLSRGSWDNGRGAELFHQGTPGTRFAFSSDAEADMAQDIGSAKADPEKRPDAPDERVVHYDGSAGAVGSLRGIAGVFGREWATPAAIETLARQNKPGGWLCHVANERARSTCSS